LDRRADELIYKFEKEVGIEKAISDEIDETEIGDVSWRFGGREVSATTPDGLSFIWLIDSYGDRHFYSLFDILDENGKSVEESKLTEESDEEGIKNESVINEDKGLSYLLNSYLDTALWSSLDDDGNTLDKKYSIEDISPESINRAKKDINAFIKKASAIVNIDKYDVGTVMHDFWLTRNRHGAGFWDGDYEEEDAKKLTDLSHDFGEVDIIVGDDGKLHMEGEKVVSESYVEKKVKYKGKEYIVNVLPDIAVRGGEKGKGTTVSVWTDAGVRGYQGPYNEKKVLELIKKNVSESITERSEKGLKENHPELDEMIKSAVQSAIDSVASKYELVSVEVEPIEHKSRAGFISSNDGGYQATGFSTVGYLIGTGYVGDLPKKAMDAVLQADEKNRLYALESFKKKYSKEIEGIPEDKLNYNDLLDMGKTKLAENLDGIHQEMNSEDTVMFHVKAMFVDDTDLDGDYTFTIQGVVNWESPYHRSMSKFEDYYERHLTFSAEEIKDAKAVASEVAKELENAIDHMGATGSVTVESRMLESDPSVKPPKKWASKMVKSMQGKYGKETASKIMGDIWYNKLDVEKKKEIRGREGKTYGPTVESKTMKIIIKKDKVELK
jgi:hypothetical protein